MTKHKLSDLQTLVLTRLPDIRQNIVFAVAYLGGGHPSSVYRAISTLLKRGVISIDEYGVVTRTGK